MVAQTPHPSAAEPASRWNNLWSVLFYLLLVYATVTSLVMETHSGIRAGLILGLALVLGVWHTLWRLSRRGPSDGIYFVGATVLSAGLVIIDPDFLILSIGVFAPLCYHDLRWGTVALVGTGGVLLWLQRTEQGAIPWSSVLAMVLVVAAGLLLVGYFATVVRQSAERQQLIDELRRTQTELAEAERRAGVLTERQRLARDIHDTLTQGFASIAMLLEAATMSLPPEASGRRHVERALQTARDNLAESRRIVWEMRPTALVDASLGEALRGLTQELADDVGIEARTNVTGTPMTLTAGEEDHILRVAQEAMNNIRKHADASRVNVTLSYMEEAVVLDVADDGVGIPAGTTSNGSGTGMRFMRERAETLGGKFSVESAPGEGTTVALHIPRPHLSRTPARVEPQS